MSVFKPTPITHPILYLQIFKTFQCFGLSSTFGHLGWVASFDVSTKIITAIRNRVAMCQQVIFQILIHLRSKNRHGFFFPGPHQSVSLASGVAKCRPTALPPISDTTPKTAGRLRSLRAASRGCWGCTVRKPNEFNSCLFMQVDA